MKKGDRIPDISFRTRSLGEWKNVTTDDYFKGKRVILFALPGAFTPTCSNQQLPGYEKLHNVCLLYTSPSPRDMRRSRMPSSA